MRLPLGLRGRRSFEASDPGLVGVVAARAVGGDVEGRLEVLSLEYEEDRRDFASPAVGRMKLVECFLEGVDGGRGLSTGEIRELAERSSNMWAADLGLVSEISSKPAPVLMPSRISSALGLSSGSRERRRRRKV